MSPQLPPQPHADPEPTAQQSEVADLSSQSLFGTASELRIRHGTELYRLRVTRNGKLILTK